jgi:phosphatidylglycerophosphate synthase
MEHIQEYNNGLWMIRWSVIHAIVTVSITFYSLSTKSLKLLALVGALSFCIFAYNALKNSSIRELINPANAITSLRLVAVLILAAVGMEIMDSVIILSIVILILLDSLDGVLARKKHTESEFGAFLDKEIDAFFMLVLCLLLVLKSYSASWILIIGFLRYFFVILVYFLSTDTKREKKTSRARHIFTLVMIILLVLFLPVQVIRVPLACMAILLLLFSFGRDLFKIFYKKRHV